MVKWNDLWLLQPMEPVSFVSKKEGHFIFRYISDLFVHRITKITIQLPFLLYKDQTK